MKSTTGYCFTLGLGIFYWCLKKQARVAQSTTKVEYIIVITTTNRAI